ncbi:MAG: DegT/DnrJ/EryC1/StrS aminotransferase family protein, partial [Candidatus Omnitrophica bacterium]|nr:DegT/DnrJ/EryC1/StrS aminotransferase family protein [Candidatus Omnitrophota bacterium]
MAKKKMIPWARPSFSVAEQRFLNQALKTSWISRGPLASKFEKDFAALLGADNGLAVSSGTAALYLALSALEIGPGDEVIVPGMTFVAPANMVLAVGAK